MTEHNISRDRALELILRHEGSREKIEVELSGS
jgi:hypothetical protein